MIITDVMMPVMGGVERYRQLKDRAETRAIPIIVMGAGRSRPPELRDVDTFIPRPFDLNAVETAVRRHLPTR